LFGDRDFFVDPDAEFVFVTDPDRLNEPPSHRSSVAGLDSTLTPLRKEVATTRRGSGVGSTRDSYFPGRAVRLKATPPPCCAMSLLAAESVGQPPRKARSLRML
jgi:hypothetical protein